MYIATVPNRNSPPAILLRESYRDKNKIRTRTLANLSNYHPDRIKALSLALKGEFDNFTAGDSSREMPQVSDTFGTYFVLKALADALGISSSLTDCKRADLMLFLILTRIAHRGSRLSAVRFAKNHAVCDILGVHSFDEDDLYLALDELDRAQASIETKLYKRYLKTNAQPPSLILYDVTSSYLEGEKNELGFYGYNRDGKRGKKQIVIGLLSDKHGEPLAVRVFEGNTADVSTVAAQIEAMKAQFKIKEVVFVGDRGMVKTKAQEALGAESYRYITALTDAQVRTLLTSQALQMSFFDKKLYEVESNDKRYVLMRNDDVKKKEFKRIDDKIARIAALVKKRNDQVSSSKRAVPQKGLDQLNKEVSKYKLSKLISLSLHGSAIEMVVDEAAKTEWLLLAGCYCLVTDVDKALMDSESVHAAYRQLQNVEQDFRTLKTGFLEVRPIFVRKKERTRAHVFVAMLALKIVRLFRRKLQDAGLNCTVSDALDRLSSYAFLKYKIRELEILRLPKPSDLQGEILAALGIKLPVQINKNGKRKANKRRSNVGSGKST